MKFLVTVRWHANGTGETVTERWLISAFDGTPTTLVLVCCAGHTISIPLAYIEYMQVERKG